jgi:hypothetical protein
MDSMVSPTQQAYYTKYVLNAANYKKMLEEYWKYYTNSFKLIIIIIIRRRRRRSVTPKIYNASINSTFIVLSQWIICRHIRKLRTCVPWTTALIESRSCHQRLRELSSIMHQVSHSKPLPIRRTWIIVWFLISIESSLCKRISCV